MNHKTGKNVLLPRTAFSLFIIDLPRLRGNALKSAVRNYLVGLFPEDIGDRHLVIKRNNRKKGSYLVFVLEPGQMIASLPVSTLFVMKYFGKESAKVLFLDTDWAELLLIENGALLKSEIKSREAAGSSECVTRFFGPDIEKLDIFCHRGDYPLFDGKEQPFSMAVHELEKELDKIPVHTYSLFEQLSTAKKVQKTLLVVLAILVTAGTGIVFHQYQKLHEAEIARLRQFEDEQKLRTEAERRDRQRLLELQERYFEYTEHKTAGPYETADVISRCLDDRARISSITIKDGFFQMEAEASDSLEILNAFENTKKVLNPTLQQIHPLQGGERFTISGTVLPDRELVDPSLPVREQVTILEALIEKEEKSFRDREKLRPSAFGVNIRGLLKKWNCIINTYQYFTSENDREIEFSIRTTSSRFFNFLREASENNGGWIFTLVQLRNLAPQNAVDAVFRVKAETITDNTAIDSGPYEEAPAVRISRHYYVPPPPRPELVKEEPAPEPPPPEPPAPPVKPEQAPWLEYIGATSDNTGSQFIYVKNTRNGAILRLEDKDEGDNRYFIAPSGSIEAFIEEKLYEIKKEAARK